MRADIYPGARFPNYELPDHTNTPRRLSELQGNNPMILTLARGHYCPKEMQQHLELAALWPKIRVAYTAIVIITTEDMLALNEFRTAIGACWPFLSDRERVLQQDLQIEEYTETHYDRPLIPHTLVLEPDLRVYRIYNGYWFWGRPSASNLWDDLREVTRRCRPDWDIAVPGMREAWESRDRSRFFSTPESQIAESRNPE